MKDIKSSIADLEITDFESVAKRINKDIAEVEDYTRRYIQSLVEDRVKIEQAYMNKDYYIVRDLLHYIRGPLGFTSLPRFKEALDTFHQSLRDGTSADEIKKNHERFFHEMDVVIEMFHKS